METGKFPLFENTWAALLLPFNAIKTFTQNERSFNYFFQCLTSKYGCKFNRSASALVKRDVLTQNLCRDWKTLSVKLKTLNADLNFLPHWLQVFKYGHSCTYENLFECTSNYRQMIRTLQYVCWNRCTLFTHTQTQCLSAIIIELQSKMNYTYLPILKIIFNLYKMDY